VAVISEEGNKYIQDVLMTLTEQGVCLQELNNDDKDKPEIDNETLSSIQDSVDKMLETASKLTDLLCLLMEVQEKIANIFKEMNQNKEEGQSEGKLSFVRTEERLEKLMSQQIAGMYKIDAMDVLFKSLSELLDYQRRLEVLKSSQTYSVIDFIFEFFAPEINSEVIQAKLLLTRPGKSGEGSTTVKMLPVRVNEEQKSEDLMKKDLV
jgi:hypothetical protein